MSSAPQFCLHQDLALRSLFARDQLSDEQHLALELHVEQCEHCQELLANMAVGVSFEQEMRHENEAILIPSATLERAAQHASTYKTRATQAAQHSQRQMRPSVLWLSSLACIIVLIVLGPRLIPSRQGEHPPRVQNGPNETLPEVTTPFKSSPNNEISSETQPEKVGRNEFQPSVLPGKGFLVSEHTRSPDDIPFFVVIAKSKD